MKQIVWAGQSAAHLANILNRMNTHNTHCSQDKKTVVGRASGLIVSFYGTCQKGERTNIGGIMWHCTQEMHLIKSQNTNYKKKKEIFLVYGQETCGGAVEFVMTCQASAIASAE